MKSSLSSNQVKANQQGFGVHSARFANKTKPKNFKYTLKRLSQYFSKEIKQIVFVLFIVFLTTMLVLNIPMQIGNIIDRINENGLSHVYVSIVPSLMILLLFYVTSALLTWFSEFLIASISQRIIKRLRKDLFNKLGKLPISFFDSVSHGDIMSRFTNDIDNVSTVISQSTTTFLSSIITVIGSITIMSFLNLYLTLGVLVSVPLIFTLSQLISKRTLHIFKTQQRAVGGLNGIAEESVYGLTMIQNYNQEAVIINKFMAYNNEAYQSGKAAQIWTGLLMPVMNVINNLTFAIIGLLGGYLIFKGQISVGVVASFVAYSRHFVRPLNELASIYTSLMSAIAGSERVFEVLEEVEELKADETIEHVVLNGAIQFDQVDFQYTDNEKVLEQVSFEVKAGQKVAIVGPTGAGKTTIINLIAKFYDIDRGHILLDGYNIHSLNRNYLRGELGIVLQDTYLFSGTIFENIHYGNLDASEEAVYEAAQMAYAHHFIQKLPHQYQTRLTFGGANISHGQRQLITIARAILANPKILILDEATSSVDIRTEKLISKAMIQMMQGRTTFIIAHRLSTIMDADLILVVDQGRIVEQGNHEFLMGLNGYYAQMILIQQSQME